MTRITRKTSSPRAASNLTFALNHYFGGHNAIGYHLFNRAVEIAPGFLAPHINLAAAYKDTSLRTSLSHLAAAGAIDPEDREVPLMTAEILERLGETDRAIGIYEEAATMMK